MAFDGITIANIVKELKENLLDGRINKIAQPEPDELLLTIKTPTGQKRLYISASASLPLIYMTEQNKQSPMNAPNFCMLLRKHINNGRIVDISQPKLERIIHFDIEHLDELGDLCRKRLVVEIMGKHSNLMLLNDDRRVMAVLHPIDFSTSALRQVLPGMTYELPPPQEKTNPLDVTSESFWAMWKAASPERPADKWISTAFLGISAAVAREIVWRTSGETDTPVTFCRVDKLWENFSIIIEMVRTSNYTPTMILSGTKPVEYAFCELRHYGADFEMRPYTSAGQMLDDFFHTRDRENHIRQRAADVLRILTNADARLRKKLELQRGELADCERGEEYKKYADLITGNLYMLSRGMSEATLTDYSDYREDGTFGTCTVALNNRLSPSANAQVYYKKYNKSKTARVELSKQIEIGEAELRYIDTVFDALTHAETAADLAEIREELYRSGYASRMKNYALAKKMPTPTVAEFRTSGGYRVLCGKNNLQNEYITHKVAEKLDYWFHARNLPGSHVLLVTGGKEPTDLDFTLAAEIAALYSKAEGDNIAVDYTLAKNVKKPPSCKPGKVIYHTNWTAYVTPDADRIGNLRVK